MKKDAYYFPHFSNSRNDSKVIKLRRVLGIEGYGIYFMLLEVLREQTDFKMPLTSVDDLSYEWHTSREKIISVINDYELFKIDDLNFFSPKLILYLQPYVEKSERARLAANKRWDKVNAKAYANALPEKSKSNASKVKESKGKESKGKELNGVDLLFEKFKLITGKKLRVISDSAKRQFNARLKEGHTLDDILEAVENCHKDKYHIENPQYLTMEFITRSDKLQKYINANSGINSTQTKSPLWRCKFNSAPTKDYECDTEEQAKQMYFNFGGAFPESIERIR